MSDLLKLIPSGAPRWALCPGSAGLEAPYPFGPTHPTTIEGRALHWVAERVLMSWLPINNFPAESMVDYLGKQCESKGALGHVITDEMVWAGNVYLQEIWNTASTYPEGLQVETQVSAWSYIKGFAGRSDAVWISEDGTQLVVYDLKFGHKAKKAFENWQLISYALAALGTRTRYITLVLVQPRGRNVTRPVMRWSMTIEQFWVYAQRLIDAAAEARGPNPRTIAGPHCLHCKAAARCGTNDDAAMNAYDFGLAAVGPELTEAEIAHQIYLLDRASDIVKARLNAMESLAVARITEGNVVPGYEQKKGLKNRDWTVPPEQAIEIGRMYGVDIEDSKPATPKQAEGRGLPREVIDLFTFRAETAPKLVRKDRAKAREIFQQ